MKIIKVRKGIKSMEIVSIKVDDDDYPKLIKFTWVWKDGYATTTITRRTYQMHRMIMGARIGEDVIIDHIDTDHTNNQKANLRRANRFENQQNRNTNKDNTLPKGIRILPNGKYNVRVQAYNQRRAFGAFDTLEEAIEARNARAREVHGEFSRDSYLIEEPDE